MSRHYGWKCPKGVVAKAELWLFTLWFPAASKAAFASWGWSELCLLSWVSVSPVFARCWSFFSDSNILQSKLDGCTQHILEMELLYQMVPFHMTRLYNTEDQGLKQARMGLASPHFCGLCWLHQHRNPFCVKALLKEIRMCWGKASRRLRSRDHAVFRHPV